MHILMISPRKYFFWDIMLMTQSEERVLQVVYAKR